MQTSLKFIFACIVGLSNMCYTLRKEFAQRFARKFYRRTATADYYDIISENIYWGENKYSPDNEKER